MSIIIYLEIVIDFKIL